MKYGREKGYSCASKKNNDIMKKNDNAAPSRKRLVITEHS